MRSSVSESASSPPVRIWVTRTPVKMQDSFSPPGRLLLPCVAALIPAPPALLGGSAERATSESGFLPPQRHILQFYVPVVPPFSQRAEVHRWFFDLASGPTQAAQLFTEVTAPVSCAVTMGQAVPHGGRGRAGRSGPKTCQPIATFSSSPAQSERLLSLVLQAGPGLAVPGPVLCRKQATDHRAPLTAWRAGGPCPGGLPPNAPHEPNCRA